MTSVETVGTVALKFLKLVSSLLHSVFFYPNVWAFAPDKSDRVYTTMSQ